MSISQRSGSATSELALPRPYNTVSDSNSSLPVRGKLSPTVSSSHFEEPALIGLRNLGNSCYQNAVLQCLLHAQDFWKLLHAVKIERDSLGHLLLDLYTTATEPRSTGVACDITDLRRIRELIGLKNKAWKSREQQDALEFLLSLLDTLSDDFKARRGNPVDSLIRGTLISKTACNACTTVSEKRDPFFVLCLPVEARSLQESLTAYQQSETLKGSEQYHCDKCRCKVDAKRNLEISDLPNLLIVCLKRFKWESGSPEKNSLCVKCPMTGFEVIKGVRYSLVGTVQHSGESVNHGHYTAHVSERGRWYLSDDATVKEISVGSVVNADTYILFYRLEA